MTVDQAYLRFKGELMKIYDARESSNISDWVFENIAGIKRLDRITHKQTVIDTTTIQKLNESLGQLLLHRPVQYVLEEAWFYKMKLFVNESVLIPRPETEELVEWIVEKFKTKNPRVKILDIGTGSGCIAIALKIQLPDAEIHAIDISESALGVAHRNADNCEVQIKLSQIDFLDEKSWDFLPSFDILISNPPYIPNNEKEKMDKNVKEHEPHIALFVDSKDPFIFYKAAVRFAKEHLNAHGEIYMEIHEDYSTEVGKIFADKSFTVEFKKDIHRKQRMIRAFK